MWFNSKANPSAQSTPSIAGRQSRSRIRRPSIYVPVRRPTKHWLARNEVFCAFFNRSSCVDCLRRLFAPELLERPIDKRPHIPAIHVLEWSFAGNVVTARQHALFEVQPYARECVYDLQRILLREGQIVVGIDHQNLLVWAAGFCARRAIIEANRADRRPQCAQTLLRKTG